MKLIQLYGRKFKALQKTGKQLFSNTGESTSSHQIMWNKQNVPWACKSLAKLVKDKDGAFAKILSKQCWKLHSSAQLSKDSAE